MAIIKDHIPIYREIFRLPNIFKEPILTFGYQDILGKNIPKDFNYQDLKHLLLARGINSIITLDPFDDRSDLKYDMNCPVPESEHEKYNTLIDIGSIEHVFDTRRCLENCMRMVKTGGHYFLHTHVKGMPFHGFHTFNHELILDAFNLNNFSTQYLKYTSFRGISIKNPDQANDSTIWIIGKKTTPIKTFHIPQQERWLTSNFVISNSNKAKIMNFILPKTVEYWLEQSCPPIIFRLLKNMAIKIKTEIDKNKMRLAYYPPIILYRIKKLFKSIVNKTNSDSKTVVVIGIGRTGTSTIAGILNALGVDMGCFPIGYFEDYYFRKLNHQILRVMNIDPLHPPINKPTFNLSDNLKAKINKTIKLRRARLWGWKDPRTSLLLDIYQPYLNNVHLIICKRKHQDIYQSHIQFLKQYNRSFSSDMINRYYQFIDEFIRKNRVKYIINNLEDFKTSPQQVVDRIINFLKIDVDSQKRQRAIDLINPSLIHSYDNEQRA